MPGACKRLRSVEPEMLKPEVQKPEGEKKEKEKVGSRATWAGGFSAFANGPSGFGKFKSAEKKAACTCLEKYEGLTGKVVNGRFVPHVGKSGQAGTFNFSGYRESGNGDTFGAGFGTKPKQEQPKQEKPKEETPKDKQKKPAKPEEKPKARQQEKTEFVEPEKKPKAWAKVETDFFEPEEKPKKEYRRKGEYHNENLASKIKIPNYKPKPAPRPEKRKDEDSHTFKSFNSHFEPSEPLNRPLKKPGVKAKVNLKISETFDTVRGERVKRFASQEYRDWVKACMVFFEQQKTGEEEKTTTVDAGMNSTSTTDDLKFPKITRGFCKLEARECVKGEFLDCCQHDVQRCLRGSGVNTEGESWLEKLKKERIRWHPDKFAHKMGKKFEKEA